MTIQSEPIWRIPCILTAAIAHDPEVPSVDWWMANNFLFFIFFFSKIKLN